mmetsp:Transcript_30671/g.47069  ORF Transcript_30671/g.47069 Transcript_30671/m.47069 type:complete len:206 (+) Transcript_30671:979-1596(+)
MFGLGNQISGDDIGLGCVIANDQYFGRSCQHINPTMSIDDGFGSGDPFIAWANNDIAGFNVGIGDTIGHGGNGLGTSDTDKDIGTGNVGGSFGNLCRTWTCQDDLGTSCRTGCDSRHNDRGGQGIASSRSVTSCGSTGADGMTGFPSRNVDFHIVYRLTLGFGKELDTTMNVVECRALLFIETFIGQLTFVFRDNQGGGFRGDIS